jgi:integrase
MSVFQRFDGVWHFRYCHKGQVIRRSTKQGNKRVAEEMERADRSARAKGELGLGEKPVCPPLSQFLLQRVQPWAAKLKTPKPTWYRSGINPLLAHAIKDSKLDMITSESITEYCAQRQADGCAVGTINRELRVLRRCLRLAAEWGIISAAPKVAMAGAEVRRERVVRDDEFRKYLNAAPPLLKDVAIILSETGLRPDECHRLEWAHVEFDHNYLRVLTGKTAAARRQLPLTPAVRGVLEQRHAECADGGYVFPAPTKSGHIDHSTLKKQHRNALSGSGVAPFLLYSLRHTFATKLGLTAKIDAWTLCRIMGWSSLAVAMTYIHPDQKRVLEVFGGHVSGHVPKRRKGKASLALPHVVDTQVISW